MKRVICLTTLLFASSNIFSMYIDGSHCKTGVTKQSIGSKPYKRSARLSLRKIATLFLASQAVAPAKANIAAHSGEIVEVINTADWWDLLNVNKTVNYQDLSNIESFCAQGHCDDYSIPGSYKFSDYIEAKTSAVYRALGRQSPAELASILEELVKMGDIEGAKSAIERGGDPDVRVGEKRETLLVHMIKQGNTDFAKWLVEHGANVNRRSYFDTPLVAAIIEGNFELVEYLIDHGADVDSKDWGGRTSLIIACEEKMWQIAEYLIERGANINAVGSFNDSVLSSAIDGENWDFVDKLIELGVNTNDGEAKEALKDKLSIIEDERVKELWERLNLER